MKPARKPQAILIGMTDATPALRALREALLTENDLLRLKAIARLHARGLPNGITAGDLLQEAILRMLNGTRQKPPEISVVAFLAGVMRSLRSEYWRRQREEENIGLAGVRDPKPDPEQQIAAVQQLALLHRLFAGDAQAICVLQGLSAGFTPKEMQRHYGLSKTDYDSTRKRMRRALLREGLAWRRP